MAKCRDCKYFYMDGDRLWELPQFDYPNCSKKPNFAHLKSFPFKDTKCKDFEVKE